MTVSTLLRAEVAPGVHLITLNRPERLNAISETLIAELRAELGAVAEDRSARVVVLTGSGRGFCAGLDLKEWGQARPGAAENPSVQVRMRLQRSLAELMMVIRTLPQPVIAAINGPATGGGLAFALASDVRIAGASARFGTAFVRIGVSGCDVGVSWLLPRLIGASRAFELMLTGRVVDAAEADRIGLVSRVVPDDELLDAALGVATEIVGNSPFGVRMTKDVMWHQLEINSMSGGIALENTTQVMTTFTADQREAVTAFLERRPPEFTDS